MQSAGESFGRAYGAATEPAAGSVNAAQVENLLRSGADAAQAGLPQLEAKVAQVGPETVVEVMGRPGPKAGELLSGFPGSPGTGLSDAYVGAHALADELATTGSKAFTGDAAKKVMGWMAESMAAAQLLTK
jgi:hypothetical protein